ncbi:disease resistance protein RGA2-like isoform X2 [Salvia hispanica]|uniref:disease resistance protein RGA2-like isoform X2 n=1 Tax=Salvia hispanica TaxID=49212 RepID=UPI002009316F|nr:disease resistance protein RGA2-like isoform X2 [Salvia hispanica]
MDGGAAAIEVLLQNLINLLNDEFTLHQGLKSDARKLQCNLKMIRAYLRDAEKKCTTETVKIWLRELEAVAFDADNVLDELSYHLLHKKVNKMKSSKDKVPSCFSSFNGISRRRNMALTIKQINADFDSLNKRAFDLGLQNMVVNAPAAAAAHTSIETDSSSLDPIFIGRDDDVSKLVDMLTEIQDGKVFSMVALVGMGGIGKTTLTKRVFNHERVKARFGVSRIWVHVSQTFDLTILFKKILYKLTKRRSDEVESRHEILEKIQEALKTKTYLLVLDNIWNENVQKWEYFMNFMSRVTSTKGNGIIITTRREKVASIVNPFYNYHLKLLSDQDCFSIIKAKVVVLPSYFEWIGEMIATRCQGLPLAATVVGGVLRSSKSIKEWRFINENWLSDGKGGWEIEKHELIELWMAEEFLHPSRGEDMESVGDMYFNVLLQNSLLQVQMIDDYGNVLKCVVHDLVHDLASSVLSNNADGGTPYRYMFLKEESSPIPKEVAKHLRTLFLEGETSGTTFSNFNCLRTLTLSSSNYEELPNSVRKLIHLRNLNISKTCIKNLPKWIGELHHLQTLRIELALEKLPTTLKYLINLRHLHIDSSIELPAEIGRLTNLQTLPHFSVGKEKGYQIEELGRLKNLKGTLEIRNLEKVHDNEEALKANIFGKPNLFDLVFEWNDGREDETNDESVLEGLQPHVYLKKLKISGFKGKRFPTWVEKMEVRYGPQDSCVPLYSLIKITFCKCSEIDEIPTLEHLPNLKSLSLKKLKKVRFINTSFNYLTSLEIEELHALECLPQWLFLNNKNLSYLRISKCHVLRELPDGVDTLNSLEYLHIHDCENLTSIGNPSGGARQSQWILHELSIKGCIELTELPCQMLESWAPTIEDLKLEGLRSLKNLPLLIDCLSKSATPLTQLTIKGVPKLMAANSGSVESWHFSSLKSLEIDVSVEWSREDSVGIAETVEGILQRCRNSLTSLHLKGVENWEWVPQSIHNLTVLDKLRLENTGIEELRQSIQNLTLLVELKLENIGIEELPQWLLGNLSSLTRLYLWNCNKLKCLPSMDAMKHLTKLKGLYISNCPELRIDSEWRNHHQHVYIEVDGKHVRMS